MRADNFLFWEGKGIGLPVFTEATRAHPHTESRVDKGRGPMATVLVKQGTLKLNNWFVVGEALGRVRALIDTAGQPCTKADPSFPVSVVGFKDKALPNPGNKPAVCTPEYEY